MQGFDIYSCVDSSPCYSAESSSDPGELKIKMGLAWRHVESMRDFEREYAD